MRPVRQSIFPGDPSGHLGDCLRACVASLVSENLDDVPSDAGLAGDPVDLIVLTGDVGLGTCGTEVPW